MDNILVLDVSGSMAGGSLRELKRAVVEFITLIEKLGLGDRIAIITFGGKQARTAMNLTSNYNALRNCVNGLVANGSTPMAEGNDISFVTEPVQD
jgi:Mg-chelatase subunit ChlD